MAIPTSRTSEAAEITIDTEVCRGCGRCVEVCKDFGLTLENGKACRSESPIFGCIACGHCMAVCPSGAIKIMGRTLSPGDLFELPDNPDAPSWESLVSLLERRRSIREFQDSPVERQVIEKFRRAHGIKHKSREGLFVIMGYPKVSYSRGIRRTFASVTTN